MAAFNAKLQLGLRIVFIKFFILLGFIKRPLKVCVAQHVHNDINQFKAVG